MENEPHGATQQPLPQFEWGKDQYVFRITPHWIECATHDCSYRIPLHCCGLQHPIHPGDVEQAFTEFMNGLAPSDEIDLE